MLKGSLDDFALADIFKLLSFSKKTGRVEVVRKAGMGRVFFRDGEVYYAESSLSREPLGQKLIRARALTENHLRQALDRNAETGERVGQIFLREGWITAEQLELAVKQQIEDAVFDLLRWELGDLEWEPNVTLEPEVPISVSVENLIMESSRRLDELETIARKVPSSHAVVAVTPAPPEGAVEINITPDEWRVLVLVDGVRNIENIANTIGLDEFQTMKIVHGMVSAGLIEVVGEDLDQEIVSPELAPLETETLAPPPPPPPPAAEVTEPVENRDAPVEDEAPAEHIAAAEHVASDETLTQPFEEALEALEALEDPLRVERVPDGEEVVEETLFEAGGEGQPGSDMTAPPEDWFADPDLSTELFDSPPPGHLATRSVNGTSPADADPAEAPDEGPSSSEPINDETLIEIPDPERNIPPPPPIRRAAGPERTAAVRELADLFEEVPERPKRPDIRRLESPDEPQKRRVEDDEQVTKGLISRLIEGVKGL